MNRVDSGNDEACSRTGRRKFSVAKKQDVSSYILNSQSMSLVRTVECVKDTLIPCTARGEQNLAHEPKNVLLLMRRVLYVLLLRTRNQMEVERHIYQAQVKDCDRILALLQKYC